MSVLNLTKLIQTNDVTLKLASCLIDTLSGHFSFDKDTAWNMVCKTPFEKLSRKLKRNKKKDDPFNKIKHARTAFSFFTQTCRRNMQTQYPDATFGELSQLVGKAWAELSADEKQRYKQKEADDKSRYAAEKAEKATEVPQPVLVDVVAPDAALVVAAETPRRRARVVATAAPAASTPDAETVAPVAVVVAAAPVVVKSKGRKPASPPAAPVVEQPVLPPPVAPVVVSTPVHPPSSATGGSKRGAQKQKVSA